MIFPQQNNLKRGSQKGYEMSWIQNITFHEDCNDCHIGNLKFSSKHIKKYKAKDWNLVGILHIKHVSSQMLKVSLKIVVCV